MKATCCQEARNLNNLIQILTLNQKPNQASYCFVPRIMLSNTMSLVPKLIEVQEFLLRSNVDIGFITET